MSDDKKVPIGLDIRTSAADGYTAVTATNEQTYYYKYSGGSDNDGNVNVKKDDKTKVTVTVTGGTNFKVGGVLVNNDADNDISVDFAGAEANLTDKATDLEEAIYYQITVCDTSTGSGTSTDPLAYFTCDPTIKNVPNN